MTWIKHFSQMIQLKRAIHSDVSEMTLALIYLACKTIMWLNVLWSTFYGVCFLIYICILELDRPGPHSLPWFGKERGWYSSKVHLSCSTVPKFLVEIFLNVCSFCADIVWFPPGSREVATSEKAEWLMCFSSPLWHLSDRPRSFCVRQSTIFEEVKPLPSSECDVRKQCGCGRRLFSEQGKRSSYIMYLCVCFKCKINVGGGCIVLLQGACVGGGGLKQKLDCCTNWNVIPATCDGFLLGVVKGVVQAGYFSPVNF